MAICEKCIHNSVCKYGENRSDGTYCTGEKCKQFATADVVPRSDVVVEVVTEIKNFITNEIAKREYHTEVEIKTQAKTLNRVWAMLDKIEENK